MLESILKKSRHIILPIASFLTFSSGAYAEDPPKEPAPEDEKEETEPVNFENRSYIVGLAFNLSFPVSPDRFQEQYKSAEFFGALNVGFERIWKHFGYSLGVSQFIYKIKDDYKRIGDGNLTFRSLTSGFSFYPILNNKTIPFFSVSGGYFGAELSDPSPSVEATEKGVGISSRFGFEYEDKGGGGGISGRVYAGYDHVFIGEGFGMFSVGFGVYLNNK